MVSLRTLGVAAGLGELGKAKVFLTPEFGPRQRVFGIFTDAELEPTPLFKGKVCDDCNLCGIVHRGDDPRFSPFWNGTEEEGGEPSFNTFSKHRFRHLAVCVGRGCVRACLHHLEQTGRIKAKFKTPFTEGKRWKLDEAPETIN